jgi:ATP-binding cassette, subfamily B, bacterial MsbA
MTVRGLLWKFRFFVIGALVANLAAAVFEGSTMAVLTVALETVETGSLSQTSALPDFLVDLARSLQNAAGTQGVFLLLVVAAVGFQLVRSTFEYAGRAFSIYLRAWIEGDLRRRLFTQLVSLSYPQISRQKIGALASYNDQVNNVGNLINHSNQTLSDLTVVLAYVSVLMWISWQMTLLAIVALVFVTIGLRRVRVSIRSISSRFMSASVTLNERFVEYLQNIRLIHVFAREAYAISQVESIINRSVRARRRGQLRGAIIPFLMQSTTIIGAAFFLIAGYVLIERYGRGSYAGLVTFVFVLYRLMPRISSLNNAIGLISNEWPFAERIAEMLRTDDKEYERSGSLPFSGIRQGIEFQDVSLRYDEPDRAAVDNLSFVIPSGTMTALVGPSGAGKTSIVNLLLRLYDPSEGRILVDGTDLRELALPSWRDNIGVVDQETYLFNASVLENIRFGRLEATDGEVMEAARIANAHEFIVQLPQGYDTEIGDRGHRLSGGQRQRIAIARAVLRDPDLLIFDEATSALDSHSERLIQQSLEELRRDRTLVVIAHRLSTTANADQILVLEAGRLVELGTHKELLGKDRLYAQLWRLQSLTAPDAREEAPGFP